MLNRTHLACDMLTAVEAKCMHAIHAFGSDLMIALGHCYRHARGGDLP